jgi:cellulose synthase/poly-beta-1,6-N-acetylglucosamine synthase-like glycosyltransferase
MATWLFWGIAGLLAYLYVGYPILLGAVSLIRWPRAARPSDMPTVTLVIPAYNEEAVLIAKLENALELDYPGDKLEILLGNDCSDDATEQIAKSFAAQGVKTLSFTARRGKASVLNDLIAVARGEVILLCDANVFFSGDALHRLTARLADPSIGAVSGDVRLASESCSFGKGEKLYYRYERKLQLWESQVGSLMGVDGGMYVLRKELFRPLPPDTILDDFTISMRVIREGKRIVYEPLAMASEGATPSARTEFRRRARIAGGAVQALLRLAWPPFSRPVELWQFVSHKLLRWMMPAMLLVLGIANLSLARQSVFYEFTLVLQVSVYAVALAGSLSLRIRDTRLGGVAFYLVMSNAAILYGMARALFSRPTGIWQKTERVAA